jgi:hypothetical protein
VLVIVSAVVDAVVLSGLSVEIEVLEPAALEVEVEVAAAAQPDSARLDTRKADVSQRTGDRFKRRG